MLRMRSFHFKTRDTKYLPLWFSQSLDNAEFGHTKRFYYLIPDVSYYSKHVKYNLYYLCIITINRSYSLFINLLARQIHLNNEEKKSF